MSIINEALKKTGQYIQENETRNRPPVKVVSTPKPFLIYILILLAGILLSKFIFDWISRPHNLTPTSQNQKSPSVSLASVNRAQEPPGNLTPANQTSKAETNESAAAPAAVSAPSEPLAEAKSTGQDFVLNGIFFSDNDGYALVNNQIIRENDLVDGAKVIKITANTVELDSAGRPVTLSTRR